MRSNVKNKINFCPRCAMSLRPSVRLYVRPSVRLYVRPSVRPCPGGRRQSGPDAAVLLADHPGSGLGPWEPGGGRPAPGRLKRGSRKHSLHGTYRQDGPAPAAVRRHARQIQRTFCVSGPLSECSVTVPTEWGVRDEPPPPNNAPGF